MVFAFATIQWNTTAIGTIRVEQHILNIENITSMSVIIGRGFSVGVIGYDLEKVVKIVAIVIGLFFVELIYLQYQ
jgi:uncharacterized membrane protein (Fun14 family)